MIGPSAEVKDAMLEVITSRAVTVGLFVGEVEIEDSCYDRLPITFSAPQDDGDIRFIENENEVRFEIMERDHTIDHWGVFGAGGELLALYRLKKSRDLPLEDNAVFRPGSLSIGMP